MVVAEDARRPLGAAQTRKISSLFNDVLDKDRDGVVTRQDLHRFFEGVARLGGWEAAESSPQWAALAEARDDFCAAFVGDEADLDSWLAKWRLALPPCGRFERLPAFLQRLCRLLFAAVNASGSGLVSRRELAAFYMRVGGLGAPACDRLLDTAYDRLTANGHLRLDLDTYERCFAGWLCGNNPNGPGEWAVVPPRDLPSHRPYPIDYSALYS